ncbi:putative mitochondrial protein AtMg00310 [Silene latifolia]|uniref:putative mitochondrial protein AtMg00310 n=1 Tax=Silene latifolia TaxID=37657 RepID=UPI003D770EB0
MAQLPTFGTYLGVPIDIPRKRSAIFLPFVDAITTRISSWSALHLSQPSKLIVISAILLASLNHVFSAVPIPIGVCRKIDALLTAFWWRNDWNKHSIHWTSKSILQAPKEYGGLGFKNTHLLSQALLLKNFWRIHSQPTAFLARYMSPKYARDLPIPLATSRVSQPSFIWSGICKAVSAANNGICWKLGNGRLLDLWSSRWINGKQPFGTAPVPVPEPSPSLSDFLLESGDWNPSMVFRYFSSICAKEIIALEPHS